MAKANVDLMVLNGTVMTMDPKRRIIENGAIAIAGNQIVDVGKSERLSEKYESEKTVNATGHLVIPGMADCHHHYASSLEKGLGFEEPPQIWLRIGLPFLARMTEEDARIAAQLRCLEQIKSGTTVAVNFMTHQKPQYADAITDAIAESGMRCVVTRGGKDQIRYRHLLPPGAQVWETSADESKSRNEEFIRKWNNQANGRIRAWVVVNALNECTDEYFINSKELADKYQTGLTCHLNEHRFEVDLSLQKWKRRPTEHLNDIGVLGSNVLAGHMVLLSEREISILNEKDVKIAHCPNACVMGGHGVPKVPSLIERGLTVSLGTDGLSDIVDMMKLASNIHQAFWGTPFHDPTALRLEDIVEMATINGARALLWDNEIGSIEVGKKADIAIFNFNQPHLQPCFSILGALVRLCSSADVITTIIDGKIVMENRTVKTLDEQQILAKAKESAERILEEAKIERYAPTIAKFKIE